MPTDEYRRNLAALAVSQATEAGLIDSAFIPLDVKQAVGRDASRTFLLPTSRGQSDRPAALSWFGGSSMPTISAGEALGGFQSDGRNVVLPGILTGLEPLLLARRLSPHTAIFVVEPSAWQVKLAMHLHDYTELLEAGRLLFLVGGLEALVDDLRRFFREHPGYEAPVHLLPTPQRSDSWMADLRVRLETGGAAVGDIQTRIVERLTEELRESSLTSPPGSVAAAVPHVVVLGVDPHSASVEHARRIQRALTKLGWKHELCVPSAPDRCHLSARLKAVADATADLVLFVGGGASALRRHLPDDLPIASWYLPGSTVAPAVAEGTKCATGRSDIVFASSDSLSGALRAAGVSPSAIESCAVAADDVVYRPLAPSTDSARRAGVEVAVLADLPDDRDEACGVTLRSHQALWRSLQIVTARNVDRYHTSIAGELLDAAQRDSDTALQDAQIRQHFEGLIATRIAPAAFARTGVEVLVERGYRVGVWGTHWTSIGSDRVTLFGAIPVGEALSRIFNEADLVLIPIPSAPSIQTALDALAAGARVVCRTPEPPFEEQYPGLQELAPHFHFYQTSAELVARVSLLAGKNAGREAAAHPLQTEQADSARRMIQTGHTLAHRLVAIWETMQSRRAVAAQSP